MIQTGRKAISDFLVIGGGVIGLAVTRSLNLKYPDAKIVLLEKEPQVSQHTSGRNSGVLHAGFYYASDSLKATFCRTGNQMWHEFCEGRGALIRKCGKLVVPKVSSLISHWPLLE
jgi:L-2-hydroxyglutarate oxidase LhgO